MVLSLGLTLITISSREIWKLLKAARRFLCNRPSHLGIWTFKSSPSVYNLQPRLRTVALRSIAVVLTPGPTVESGKLWKCPNTHPPPQISSSKSLACIRTTWRSFYRLLLSPLNVWFSKARMEPARLQFWQAPLWCCCCLSWDPLREPLPEILPFFGFREFYTSSSTRNVWSNPPAKPSGPGLFLLGVFLITASISLGVICLFIFSDSFWFSFGRLYVFRNVSVSSRLSSLLAYNCS